jgi:hypothetical protein
MNDELKKDILKYSSAAAAVISGPLLNAQFQYTDIADTVINTNNGFYNLDLDQDGTVDFRITQYVDTGVAGNTSAIIIQPYGTAQNKVVGRKIGVYNYAFNLQAATTIDVNSEWDGIGGTFNTGYMAFVTNGQSYPNSNWVGPLIDGYLGLQIVKNNQRHFGWARLDIGVGSESFIVKDFSVNLTPDSAMIAGYELLHTADHILDQVRLDVENGFLTIYKPNHIAGLNLRIIDILGRECHKQAILEENTTASFQLAKQTLYVVELEFNGVVKTEKIFLL